MSAPLTEAFRAIDQLSTPIQLIGFLGALIALVILTLLRSKNMQKLKALHGRDVMMRAITWVGVLGIGGLILGVVGMLVPLFMVPVATPTAIEHPATAPAVLAPPPPTRAPIDLLTLKNATYVLDGERVTLNDGEMIFDPAAEVANDSVYATHVHLTNWAFGDLTKDGAISAVVALQKSDGGSGIYYALVPVTRRDGRVISDTEGYTIGDRVQFKRLEVTRGKVFADVLMHRPGDSGAQASIMRRLEFVYANGRLECASRPCSDLDAFDLSQKTAQRSGSPSNVAVPPGSSDAAVRPSFDCRQAKTKVELAICSTEELRALDAEVGVYYRSLYARLTVDRRQKLKHEQIDWIVERQMQCGDNAACLRDYLQQRSAQLAAQ